MNVKEAKEKWNISEDKVYKVCRAMKIPMEKDGYVIPDNLKKPYFPDKRKFRKRDKLHIYIHVLNAITEELMIIPEIINTDNQHVRTAVRELKNTRAIVLLDGAEDNLDYFNYMIGPKYSDWTLHNTKEKLELVSSFMGMVKDVNEIVVGQAL